MKNFFYFTLIFVIAGSLAISGYGLAINDFKISQNEMLIPLCSIIICWSITLAVMKRSGMPDGEKGWAWAPSFALSVIETGVLILLFFKPYLQLKYSFLFLACTNLLNLFIVSKPKAEKEDDSK